MIKEYIILIVSLFFKPLLPLFIKKLNNNVVHIAYINLGGLKKTINLLCKQSDYNLITEVKGFLVIYIRGVPFLLGKNQYGHAVLNKYLHEIKCIYHVHQLSHDIQDNYEFLKDKLYLINIHDYFYICERFFMLDYNFNFCNYNKKCCTNIDRILIIEKLLSKSKYNIIPDDSMLIYLKPIYPKIKFMVISHGI